VSRQSLFRVEEDVKFGVVARCMDAEVADEFEDFLSERNYVLFNTKFEENDVLFYFGLASSQDRVKLLIQRFQAEAGDD